MRGRDLPAGMREVRFGHRREDGTCEPWHGCAGDVVCQTGPRIGTRWWEVVQVIPARVWARVLLRQVGETEARAAVADGGMAWDWTRRRLTHDEASS